MNNTTHSRRQPVVSHASIRPSHTLDLLSQREMAAVTSAGAATSEVFRRCALAVLSTDGGIDDARALLEAYPDFDIVVTQESRGLKLELYNAPAVAFVDGHMIEGIRHHLFAALRDVVFNGYKLRELSDYDLDSPEGITDAVFRLLRNANVVRSNMEPNLVVCWGGHSVSRNEYDYAKKVGYSLGLRGFDICTGCGPGAMKGPMKGAAIAHAKQLRRDSRFLGVTEPGIITAESPNPIVNELVILPDIEKRLEAFVRIAHGIIVFPGGVGTAEEILFLLGIKLHPDNAALQLPLIFTGPADATEYFVQIDRFLRQCLGEEVAKHYHIITGDPAQVARDMRAAIDELRQSRREQRESFSFAWRLHIPAELQQPFHPSHETMAALDLHLEQPRHRLIANLRRAFSGIVAGNVKEDGVRAIEAHGPFQLRGEGALIDGLRQLLEGFVRDGRMKIDPSAYKPCFEMA